MTDATRKIITFILQAVMAFASSIAIAMVSGFGITGIDIMIPCVVVLCFLLYSRVWKNISTDHKDSAKKELGFNAVLGVIMAVATVVGSKVDLDERVFTGFTATDVILIIFLIPFFVSVLFILFFSSDTGKINTEAVKRTDYPQKDLKHRFSWMGILIICWLPYYLTFFPGGIGNDDFECAKMCLGMIPWSNHHPVFFTFVMNLFIKAFGGSSLSAAFGVMTFFQMLLLAFTLSYVLSWLEKHNVSRLFIYVSLVFFAIHPISAIYSVYVTKDIMFACATVFLTVHLLNMCEKKTFGRKDWILLGIWSFLTIVTRNNGTFMIAALAVAMMLMLRDHRKAVIITFLIVFALNISYKTVVWSALDIRKQSFVESASIPLTQIAYTIYTDGDIDGDEKDYLESIMPFDAVKKEFEPGYVDTYKFSDSFHSDVIDEDPGKLIKVWAKLLPTNFGRYVEAYIFETCGYWHIGITNTVATEGVQPNDLNIEGTDLIEKAFGISAGGLLSELILIGRKLPVLCLLSQMAVLILAVILLTRQYVRKGISGKVIVMIPLIALWVSIMLATPAYCLFRYMCPVFFLWPVLIQQFFANDVKS